jgi:hypothetical protein
MYEACCRAVLLLEAGFDLRNVSVKGSASLRTEFSSLSADSRDYSR